MSTLINCKACVCPLLCSDYGSSCFRLKELRSSGPCYKMRVLYMYESILQRSVCSIGRRPFYVKRESLFCYLVAVKTKTEDLQVRLLDELQRH